SEVRKRKHYEKPSVRKKRKALAAKRRALKRMRKLGQRQ
ncbi:MAG: 30S ribosomal protein S21, partial [Deltaproteobacteria bacterium]